MTAVTIGAVALIVAIFGWIGYYLVKKIQWIKAQAVAKNYIILPAPPRVPQALQIVGQVFGLDLRGLNVVFIAVQCNEGVPGYLTHKRNCTPGAVAPYMPQINVAWSDEMELSSSGFVQAAWQYWEMATYGMPDVYHTTLRWTSGLAMAKQDEARAALKLAGL